jgi:hypothetical protein
VAIMTGRQESALLVLANPAVPGSGDYPHQGSGSDHDSVGLFQQRPSQGWGSVGQLMDPGYAAATFLRGLVQVPGWQRQPLWQAAQAVQRSDGAAYAQWAALGTAVAGALWDHTGGALGAQGCSVVPDPSTGTGCLTLRMAALYTQLVTGGWHPDCYRPSDPVARSDHPLGKACDAPPGSYGTLPTAAQKAAGDALAASLQASAARTGVHYSGTAGPGTPTAPTRLAALPGCRCLQHHPDHPGRHHRRPLRPRPHLGLLNVGWRVLTGQSRLHLQGS